MNCNLNELVGNKIIKITGLAKESETVRFSMENGDICIFHHWQNCCEVVRLIDFEMSCNSLIGATIFKAIESSNENDNGNECSTWTFIKIETDKGGLWMRWLGESNCNYSESVELTIHKD